MIARNVKREVEYGDGPTEGFFVGLAIAVVLGCFFWGSLIDVVWGVLG